MRFVQVGDLAYNMDLIEAVKIDRETRVVRLHSQENSDEENYWQLAGEEAERFLAWWDNKAEVWVT